MLDNGTYDALIIDAEVRNDNVALECAITSGAHKGDVIRIVTSSFATRDAVSLLGMPCTLHVDGETIRVSE
jgi:hypothetical protein